MNVVVVVGFYTLVELMIIFLNKIVLRFSPHTPLLFLFLQLIVVVALLHLSAIFHPKILLPTRAEITWPKIRQLAPIISANVASLVFGMLCLRDVDVSFFQIAQGLILPFTIITSSYTTKSSPSIPILICASFVTLGFLIGTLPLSLFTLSFDTISSPTYSSTRPMTPSSRVVSLFYGILSSSCAALHAVLIKKSLDYLEGSTVKLAWWSSVGGALVLLPFVLFSGDISFVFGLLRYGIDMHGNVGGMGVWEWWLFVSGSVVAGFFGFLLCIAGIADMKGTPVSHIYSNAASGVLQALLGVWLFGDILTVPRASSILIILTGTILYTSIEVRKGALVNQIEIVQESKDLEDGVS